MASFFQVVKDINLFLIFQIQPDSDGFVRSLGYLWVNGRPPCDSCKGRKDCWQCDIDSKAGKTVACLACRKGKKKCSYSVHQQKAKVAHPQVNAEASTSKESHHRQHLLEADSDSQESADDLPNSRAQSASEKGMNKANVMAIENQKNTVQEAEKVATMDEEDEARVTGPFIKFKRDGTMEVVRGKGLSVEKATLGKRPASNHDNESDTGIEKGKKKANVMAIKNQKSLTVQEGEKVAAVSREGGVGAARPSIKSKRGGTKEVVGSKDLSLEKVVLGKRVVSDDESESDPGKLSIAARICLTTVSTSAPEHAVRLPKQKRLRFDSSHGDVSDNNVPPSPHRYPLRSRAPQPEKTVPKYWERYFGALADLCCAHHDNYMILFAQNRDIQTEVVGTLQESNLQFKALALLYDHLVQQMEVINRALLRDRESNRDKLSALQDQFDMLSIRLEAVERKQKHRNTRPPAK